MSISCACAQLTNRRPGCLDINAGIELISRLAPQALGSAPAAALTCRRRCLQHAALRSDAVRTLDLHIHRLLEAAKCRMRFINFLTSLAFNFHLFFLYNENFAHFNEVTCNAKVQADYRHCQASATVHTHILQLSIAWNRWMMTFELFRVRCRFYYQNKKPPRNGYKDTAA